MTRYRVCGNRAVLGHQPGDEFHADLDEIQEERLTRGGHIEPVRPPRKHTTDDGPPASGGDASDESEE